MNTLLRWDPISRTQWNPFKDRGELESRLATMLASRAATGDGGKEAMTVAEWSPLVDIMEDEKQFLIRAELPDMKKEQVKLTVENDVLTISGERKYEKETTGHKHHRIERAYGSFMRSFSTATARFAAARLQVGFAAWDGATVTAPKAAARASSFIEPA